MSRMIICGGASFSDYSYRPVVPNARRNGLSFLRVTIAELFAVTISFSVASGSTLVISASAGVLATVALTFGSFPAVPFVITVGGRRGSAHSKFSGPIDLLGD